jgi:protein-disulfide isomerase
LAVSLVLGVADARLQQRERAAAEVDRVDSTAQILAQSQAVPQPPASQTWGAASSADRWGAGGFTGRYRVGPEASPIRIVMLTDYQCVDCQRVEQEIEEILAARRDVSLSVKHFPMCLEAAPGEPCNRYAKQAQHPNACWAARAAEAAGILKGDEGFWAMHRWLFGRKGGFTDAELRAGLAELGHDPATFLGVMTGPETLSRVRADCEEGNALGLFYTPMVFVNGVEFKGWQVPGALRRSVEEVAATSPPALRATVDRPVLAASKDIQDWGEQPVRSMPPDTRSWSIGGAVGGSGLASSRVVDVVLFGDYQEPFTASMDLAIRDRVKTDAGIRYTFRHYPIDPKVNPTVPPKVRPEAVHPLAGRAAQAAEAAGSLGGSQAYWKMHAWLMENVNSFSDESLRAAARGMGLDPDALLAEMGRPEIAAAIVEDARAAQQLGLTGVPMVFVNGKWVWRTTREGENIILRVIESAGRP